MASWSCPQLSTSWSKPCRSALLSLPGLPKPCFVNHQEKHDQWWRPWSAIYWLLIEPHRAKLARCFCKCLPTGSHSLGCILNCFDFNPYLFQRCQLHKSSKVPVCLLSTNGRDSAKMPSLLQSAACVQVSRKRAYCHGFMMPTAGLAGQVSSTAADAPAAARHQRPLQRLPLCEHAVRAPG